VPGLCGPEDYTVSTKPSTAGAPLTITNWVCPGTGTSATPVSAPGYLYITDANNAWTPAYRATLTCGAGDAGLIALDGGGTLTDGGGSGFDGATDATVDSTAGDTGIVMGTCSHDVCTTGGALNTSCSACTNTVCSNPTNIYCCDAINGMWGPSCVLAATMAGCASCP